jgi:hypothetical protein
MEYRQPTRRASKVEDDGTPVFKIEANQVAGLTPLQDGAADSWKTELKREMKKMEEKLEPKIIVVGVDPASTIDKAMAVVAHRGFQGHKPTMIIMDDVIEMDNAFTQAHKKSVEMFIFSMLEEMEHPNVEEIFKKKGKPQNWKAEKWRTR